MILTYYCHVPGSKEVCYDVTVSADSIKHGNRLMRDHLIEMRRPDLAYYVNEMIPQHGIISSNVTKGNDTLVQDWIAQTQEMIELFKKEKLIDQALSDEIIKDESSLRRVSESYKERDADPFAEQTTYSGMQENQFGRMIPPPSLTKDSKGRDLDKIHRWCKPTDNLFDENVLDRLDAIVETPELNTEREERLIAIFEKNNY